MKQLFNILIPPCKKCPYKLGQVQTPTSPWFQCKINEYRTFEEYRKQMRTIRIGAIK